MTTKLVVRVLDAAGALLGWAEAAGTALGDGYIRVLGPLPVLIEVEGHPQAISIHWCDVNVETRVPFAAAVPGVRVGDTITLALDPAFRVGPAAGGLPSVTVRAPVAIDVPVGRLGAG
jgi:hypothetical protein